MIVQHDIRKIVSKSIYDVKYTNITFIFTLSHLFGEEYTNNVQNMSQDININIITIKLIK